MRTDTYRSTLAQTVPAQAPVTVAEPTLWARDLLSLTALMSYDMRLTRLTLAGSKPGAPAELQFIGTLPAAQGEGVGLVGRFLERLTTNRTLAKRWSDVTFQGVDGAKDAATLTFRLSAKVAP
jgi:hypothetical protein